MAGLVLGFRRRYFGEACSSPDLINLSRLVRVERTLYWRHRTHPLFEAGSVCSAVPSAIGQNMMLIDFILANRPSSVVRSPCMRDIYLVGCDLECQELGADLVYVQMEGRRVSGRVARSQQDNESSLHVDYDCILSNVSFVFHTSVCHRISSKHVCREKSYCDEI